MEPIDLQGRVALVTGGAYGIGRATARRLAAAGASVAIADRDREHGAETIDLLLDDGAVDPLFVACDIADEQSVKSMIEKIVETFGGLDIAHNNAAVSPKTGPTAECPKDMWDTVMAVNLTGVWLCMKYEILAMGARGRGSIINTSSAVGLSPMANQPAYVTSKHGVIGLTKAAALEYATQGIRVNTICPGPVITGLTEEGLELGKYTREGLGAVAPMRRVADPTEIAAAVVWLASDASSYVTGAVLPVDGGTAIGLTSFGT